jgi:hypothetical protein
MTVRLAVIALIAFAASTCTTARRPPTPSPPAGAPSTDIYLYRLSRLLPFGSRLVNITNRRGYDNQPSWDGETILYTSVRDGQADIYRYANDQHERLTTTRESEYSPAITPDGRAFSVVRVERDSTQRLWRFPLDGGPPTVVLENVKPVGYYAWLDSTTVALFVLGSPNTLQIADTRTGRARVVTTNIGRSLQRVPESMRASYVHRVGDRWQLETVDPRLRANGTFDVDTLGFLPDSADYVVWRSPTELYTGAGSRIYRMRLPDRRWQQVAELGGLRRISRLAISPDGRTIAVVADEP